MAFESRKWDDDILKYWQGEGMMISRGTSGVNGVTSHKQGRWREMDMKLCGSGKYCGFSERKFKCSNDKGIAEN